VNRCTHRVFFGAEEQFLRRHRLSRQARVALEANRLPLDNPVSPFHLEGGFSRAEPVSSHDYNDSKGDKSHEAASDCDTFVAGVGLRWR